MGYKCKLMLYAVFMLLVSLIICCIDSSADGFDSKLVRVDGKVSKGEKVKQNGSVEFLGRGAWNAPLKISFSPLVRAHYELAPFIETEFAGELGQYTLTLTLAPKTGRVTYKNIRVLILNHDGEEISSNNTVASDGSAWTIGFATDQEPFEFYLSFSTERRDMNRCSMGQ